MKAWWLPLTLAVLHTLAPAGELAPLSEEQMAAERQRIEAQRQQGETALKAEEAACQSKFAVNDCLRPVQARKRALLSELKRQEVKLNDLERQQRAQAQRDLIAQRQQERAAQDKKAPEPSQKAHTRSEKGAARASAEVPRGSAPDAATQAENRAAYARKLEEAERHRQSLKRQQQEKPSTATTLPKPP